MTTRNIEEVFSSGVFKTYKKNTPPAETTIEHPIRVALAFLLSSFVLSPIAFLLRAFVVMVLWNWFLVALGAPLLPFWLAAGVLLMINFVKSNGVTEKADPTDTETFTKTPFVYAIVYFAIQVLTSIITLGFGWLLWQFVA